LANFPAIMVGHPEKQATFRAEAVASFRATYMSAGVLGGLTRMAKSSGKTVSVEIGLWYDEERDHIAIRIPGHDLTSVKNDPASKRGNPSLFKKLGRVLRDAGAKHPAGI
jgi:hypothetical protein